MRFSFLKYLLIFNPLLCFSQLNGNLSNAAPIYDTCRTYLYYQQIGSDAGTQEIVKARTIKDHGIVSIGTVSNGIFKKGLIIKQDRNGNIVWKKTIGKPGTQYEFTGFREAYNGDLFVIGTVLDLVSFRKTMLLCKFSADGNPAWQKNYSNNLSPEISNAKLYLSQQDECYFVAATDSAIIYGLSDNAGNLLWQRSLKTDSSTRLVDISAVNQGLMIMTNAMDSAYHVANMYYISLYGGMTDILLTRKFGGHTQRANFILHDMEMHDVYSYFSGIRSVDGQPWELVRMNIGYGYTLEALEHFSVPGVSIDTNSRSTISLYGECIAFTPGRKSNQVHLMKWTGSHTVNTSRYWASKTTWPDSIVLGGCLKTWDAGFAIFVTKEGTGGSKKTVQLKIDSAGVTPSCISRIPQDYERVHDYPFLMEYVHYSYTADMLTAMNDVVPVDNPVMPVNISCKELHCPVLPVADSCINSFYKVYQGYNQFNYIRGMEQINGSIYLAGTASQLEYMPDHENSFIAKMDANGHMLKQRSYALGNQCGGAIQKTIDNALVHYGYSIDRQNHASLFIAKVDTNLNMLWNRNFSLHNFMDSPAEIGICDLKQAADGSYFVLAFDAYTVEGNGPRGFLLKFSPTGTLVWAKILRISYAGASNRMQGRKIALDADNVYITCLNPSDNKQSSILLKFSQATGNMYWYKRFVNSDENFNIGESLNMYNGELYFTGRAFSPGVNPTEVMGKFDTDGNMTSIRSIRIHTALGMPRYSTTQDAAGNMFFTTFCYDSIGAAGLYNGHEINIKLNSNFERVYAKKRPTAYINNSFMLLAGPDQTLYEAGSLTTSFSVPYTYNFPFIVKYSPEGNVGVCPPDSLEYEDGTLPVSTAPVTCTVTDTSFELRTIPFVTNQHYLAEAQLLLCASLAGCDTLYLEGEDTICYIIGEQYTYTARKNDGCQSPVQWEWDQSKAQLIYMDNDHIRLEFLTTGEIKLKAILYSGCIPYADSMIIRVFEPSAPPNIGMDTSICIHDSIPLDAGGGYADYLWSTGQHGAYIYADTIGTWYVTVTDIRHCVSSDTIKILSLLPLPVIDATGDTSFCSGTAAILNAGPSFTAYLWNTGNSSQQISVSGTGDYWVTVKAANGCKASDTLHVLHEYAVPAGFLPAADPATCRYDTIDIGPNKIFESYLWNTGSHLPEIRTSTAGLYWLTVTDVNGCIGKDSIRVFAKECPNNIFFPRAFTPNGDGSNDSYRPGVYGTLEFYHIKIYNRWGETVFESTDPQKGWNGMLKGAGQNTGGFVWICSYKFKDGKMMSERGSFMLLR